MDSIYFFRNDSDIEFFKRKTILAIAVMEKQLSRVRCCGTHKLTARYCETMVIAYASSGYYPHTAQIIFYPFSRQEA